MNKDLPALLRDDLHRYFLAQIHGLDSDGEVTEEGAVFDVPYIRDWIAPALMKAARHEIQALAILMPPRHSKTWLATKHFIPWCFGRWPNRSNALLSYSDDFAKRFGRNILEKVQTPLHRAVFPKCLVSNNARSGSYFELKAGGMFFSAGFDGAFTGLGISGILVVDDPLKNIGDAKSPAHEEHLMDVYQSTVKTRLEGASTVMAVTRWCRGDFFDRVIEAEGRVEEGGKWTVICLPAQAGPDDPLGREPGEYLWPERWPEKWYEENKKTKFWSSLYQQAPEEAGGRRFQREWAERCMYDQPIKPGKFKTYMICDPAKNRHTADRTSIPVFAAAPNKRLFLVDWVLGRFDPDERADEFLRLYRKWQPVRAIYEEFGLVNDTWYLNQRMAAMGFKARIIPIGRKGRTIRHSKEDRIDALIPDFREGNIWLPSELSYNRRLMVCKDENGEVFDPVQYFIEQEFVEYAGEGTVTNDDGLDSFAWLHAPELGITYPETEAETPAYMKPYMRGPRRRAGGWESRW